MKNRKKSFTSFESIYGGDLINKARKHYNNISFWDYEVLEYCEIEKLDEREIYYINLYDSNNKDKGYNLSSGGLSAKGYKPTKEQIKRRSESCKKPIYQLNKDTLEIIKEWDGVIDASNYYNLTDSSSIVRCCKGIYYECCGFKWCYKDNPNLIKKENYKRKSKRILQIDKETNEVIKEWDSALEISNQLNIDRSAIMKCCKDKAKTCGGYKWKYVG